MTSESLMKPAPVVAMHEGEAACAELQRKTRRATLGSLVVVAGASWVGGGIRTEPAVLLAGGALLLILVVIAIAAGRTRVFSFALLLALSTTMGVLLGAVDGVLSTGARDANADGPLLLGAGFTCVVALFCAEALSVVVSRPTVSLLGPIAVGALLPWSSSFGLTMLPTVAPVGAWVGATLALALVLSARLADVALPYMCARDEGVSGALLRIVELPRLAWGAMLGDHGPAEHT